MKDRPILFSGAMVRAILAGQKTQTRRIVKPQPSIEGQTPRRTCPYGAPGDRLWVRETHAAMACSSRARVAYRADMIVQNQTPRRTPPGWTTADLCPWPVDNAKGRGHAVTRWTPAIHMPRALSRIDLEVTAVRVERLHDVTEEDARTEGVTLGPIVCSDCQDQECGPDGDVCPVCDCEACDGRQQVIASTYRAAYAHLWDRINGGRAPWRSNPWVWVLSFRRVRP